MSKQSFTTGQVLTAAQVNSLQANDYNQSVSVKTASYTLAAADKGTRIEFNTSGSVTCTVNSGLFDAGDTLVIQNRGAGAATVTAGTATVNTSASLVVKQYDSGVLYFVSDSSAIYFASDAADTPLTTKGDLFTFSTAADRLAVGNPGETLVANSSASVGLSWQGDYAAGKNKIINGDFNINQRNFSTTSTDSAFTYDRFSVRLVDGTVSASAQTFTAGTAPVAGYEATNFVRLSSSSQTSATAQLAIQQVIEDVRTFAGQTITVSFWAKANSGTPKLALEMQQVYGVTAPENTYGGQVTLSTSWTRYSLTVSIPSIAGKTLGSGNGLVAKIYASAGSSFNARTGTLGIQSNTFDFWGVQVEAGSVATAFQTATGTFAGELAACQRYYYRTNPLTQAFAVICPGFGPSTTDIRFELRMPVTMRTTPTAIEYSTLRISDYSTNISVTSLAGSLFTPDSVELQATVTGATAFRPYILQGNNSTSAYVAVTAEL